MSRTSALTAIVLSAALATIPAPRAAAQPKRGTSYAFLVAPADYDANEFRQLPYSAKETEEFRRMLVASGFEEKNVKFLHDGQAGEKGEGRRYLPEKKKLVAEFGLLLARVGPDDTVVVVLNGHGVHFTGDKTGYFCPVDAKLSDRDTLWAMDGPGSVFEMLKGCKAKRKLLLVNACRNDPASDRSLAGDKVKLDDEDRDEVPEGIAALYSCKPGQKSYYYDPKNPKTKDRERSLFMHHLIEAWGKSGRVTVEDVFQAVRENTAADADALFGRIQTPVVRREYKGEWVVQGADPLAAELREYERQRMRTGSGYAHLRRFAPERVAAWKRAAEGGSTAGQVLYGLSLRTGIGVDWDVKLASVWFKKAAMAGHPIGMREWGSALGSGLSEKRDLREAVNWILKAAETGDAGAMARFAELCSGGHGVEKDAAEAARWLRRAAEAGEGWGMFQLATLYRIGQGVEKSEREATRWLQAAADLGYVYAFAPLGDAYTAGAGVAPDELKARECYKKAAALLKSTAELGDAVAMHDYGHLYERGQGVDQDQAEGLRWLLKASAQDDHAAGCIAQHRYRFPPSDKEDREMIDILRSAADRGTRQAKVWLGRSYVEGRGVRKDEAEGFRWFRMAADEGAEDAMLWVGNLYFNGRGVKKDEAEALKWYRKSAEAGFFEGMLYVGFMYENGLGGAAKNLTEAIRWYQKAAQGDSDYAKENALQALKRIKDGGK